MSKLYDSDKDYMEEMKKSALAGDEEGFNANQTARNNKITSEGLGYATTNYTMGDFAKQNGIRSTPIISGVPANSYPGRVWSPDVNYSQGMWNDIDSGNLVGAMYKERMHNAKDGDLGLGYGASGMFNYQDTQGLGGLREGKYNEIQDYFDRGFQYDYRDDEQYHAMRKLKEKEADKAYKDGYAQLSRSFDGDIPVNMINKLLTTKSEIVDQADSYIPTLRQMAYDMYRDKGNQLYNQYGLLNNLVQEDKQDFYADRDFITQGVRNTYADKVNREQTDYVRGIDDREWIAYMADMEWNTNPDISWEEAMKRAKKYL